MPLPVEPISGKVVLLTGANRGIGLAAAKELRARGAKVVAGVRVPAEMPRIGDSVTVFSLDVASAASCRDFVEKARMKFGHIDGLVNNAGMLLDRDTLALELSEDDLRRVLEVNLIGPFRLCQLIIPGMTERGYGRIVNVSSALGAISTMGARYPSYRLSKLALNGLSRILAAEIGDERDVKVNSLDPGWVRTDMGGPGAHRDPAEPAREIADLVSIGRDGPSGGLFRAGEPTAW